MRREQLKGQRFIGVQEELGSGARGRGQGSQGHFPAKPLPLALGRTRRQTDGDGKTDRCYRRAQRAPHVNPTPTLELTEQGMTLDRPPRWREGRKCLPYSL